MQVMRFKHFFPVWLVVVRITNFLDNTQIEMQS